MITMTTIHHPSIHTHNHIIIINFLGKYSNLSNKSTAFIFLKHLGSSQTTNKNQPNQNSLCFMNKGSGDLLFFLLMACFFFRCIFGFFFYSWCSNFFPSFSLHQRIYLTLWHFSIQPMGLFSVIITII